MTWISLRYALMVLFFCRAHEFSVYRTSTTPHNPFFPPLTATLPLISSRPRTGEAEKRTATCVERKATSELSVRHCKAAHREALMWSAISAASAVMCAQSALTRHRHHKAHSVGTVAVLTSCGYHLSLLRFLRSAEMPTFVSLQECPVGARAGDDRDWRKRDRQSFPPTRDWSERDRRDMERDAEVDHRGRDRERESDRRASYHHQPLPPPRRQPSAPLERHTHHPLPPPAVSRHNPLPPPSHHQPLPPPLPQRRDDPQQQEPAYQRQHHQMPPPRIFCYNCGAEGHEGGVCKHLINTYH